NEIVFRKVFYTHNFCRIFACIVFSSPFCRRSFCLARNGASRGCCCRRTTIHIRITIYEPIDPDLAMVTIYDWNAKPVFTGIPDGNSERTPLLTFSLPDLKQGTYTVKWN